MENTTQNQSAQLQNAEPGKVEFKKNKKTQLYATVVKYDDSIAFITAKNYADFRKELESPEIKQIVKMVRGYEIPFTEKRSLKFF